MNHAGFFLPCGAAWERRLPDRLTPLDEKTLFSRAWTLLVCSRRGAETLSRLPRAPLCRTVLLDICGPGAAALNYAGLVPLEQPHSAAPIPFFTGP